MLKIKGKFLHAVNGLTLLELMLVFIVIVTILVLSTKLFLDAQKTTYTIAMANDLRNIVNAADRYAAFNINPLGGYSGFSNSNVPNLPTWFGWAPSTNTVAIGGTVNTLLIRVGAGPLRKNCPRLAKFFANDKRWSFSCYSATYADINYNKTSA